jgi:hypothetical protein
LICAHSPLPAAGLRIALTPEMFTNETGQGDPAALIDEQALTSAPLAIKPKTCWTYSHKSATYPMACVLDLKQERDLGTLWLFDKNDIKTATKVLMSEHAFGDAGIRSRLEPKGELVEAAPQAQILLETATLQLLATVVDLEYGQGPMPQNSYFERITLELAVWPRGA